MGTKENARIYGAAGSTEGGNKGGGTRGGKGGKGGQVTTAAPTTTEAPTTEAPTSAPDGCTSHATETDCPNGDCVWTGSRCETGCTRLCTNVHATGTDAARRALFRECCPKYCAANKDGCTDTTEIYFGGATSKEDYDGWLMRPQYKTTEHRKRDTDVYEPCAGDNNCWTSYGALFLKASLTDQA